MAAVGAATHLVLWLRRYLRGESGRRRAVRDGSRGSCSRCSSRRSRAGNVMYPTYKVEVRAAYLENAAAVAADAADARRASSRASPRASTASAAGRPRPPSSCGARPQAARWFDVKEHWIALGMFASAALLLILSLWDPQRDGRALAPIVIGLAVIVAGTVWLGAIIGVLTAAWRAV